MTAQSYAESTPDSSVKTRKFIHLSGVSKLGYGRKAVQYAEKVARDLGLDKIVLTVNKNNVNSIKAYEKIGFTNAGPVVQDIGSGFVMDDYKMEKTF